MKIKKSNLLNESDECMDFDTYLITGLHLDIGNNPSTDYLYNLIAVELYDFIMNTPLQDSIILLYEHNYSSFCGKVKIYLSISDLADYARDLKYNNETDLMEF